MKLQNSKWNLHFPAEDGRNGPNSTHPIIALFVTIWEVLSLSRQEAWRNTNSTNQSGTHLQTSIVDCIEQ
jgi:hypothetical protein